MTTIVRQASEYGSHPLIFLQSDRPLATSLRTLFSEHRAYFLDTIRLGEQAPADCMPLNRWSTPANFSRLNTLYGDYIYRENSQMERENKPLQSLWAQWYFGLLLPPMIMALLLEKRALDISPEHCHVEFTASGRPAVFWLDVREDEDARFLSPPQRMDRLIRHHLIPVVNGIAQHGGINSKLIWSNTGFIVHWFLGEIAPLIAEPLRDELEQAFFFSPALADGGDNPFFRTMLPRDGEMQRRTCCQRYRLPDVQRCGNCTLNPR
ncbi:siderophore-iron reductase FhuF [Erwinia psidii]|uniref:Hydroxamate siderophore iron reductase FhuF n=1 Tax=Erwinia psidii TaxID=69224 RepID=A0A3N6RVA6_9GAMM|nr:siderophore-iron reductase FhuF [Erwinia psidii]MCX8959427.1 hydroxamate siderophore iron reductase FhuF [Erwinia psidii]MCX8962683.1 hydroxamate siderophore iron reductase FhuF [Erwinia psidii]MCX8964279.1 hydroxamate siderophore iron reductase FhuF [Erwinia psidii]RQM36888.1 hydroxamate siderophore iron reductase FhuF [Erwinia psidii]